MDLSKIENLLRKYDQIVLIDDSNDLFADGIIEQFMKSHLYRSSSKKILILSAKKYGELVLLYHTYEFSDRFKLIGRSSQYGTLFNYVDNGLLTEDEALELLLK